MAKLNPSPFNIPIEFRMNRDTNQYFTELHNFLRQLAANVGGDNGGLTNLISEQGAHAVYIGPATGEDAVPSFRLLARSDLPDLDAADFDLGPTDTPTFAGLIVSGLRQNAFVFTGVDRELDSTLSPDDGELLIGRSGDNPIKNTLTEVANQTEITNGPGSITIGLVQDIAVTSSPEFVALTLSGLTADGFLFVSSTNVLTSAAATDGQLLIGATGAPPVLAEITGTANQIDVTNGPNSIALSLADAVEIEHLVGASGTPAIAADAGAGTTPTIAITGTDLGFRIDLTTGTTPTGTNATIATVTFDTAFAAAPFAVFSASNANSALLGGLSAVFVTTTTTTLVLTSGTTALTAATQYIWDFHVIG